MAELLCKLLTERMLKVSQVKYLFVHQVSHVNGTASIFRQPIKMLSTTCSSHSRLHDRCYSPFNTSVGTVNHVTHTSNGSLPVVLIQSMATGKDVKRSEKGSKSGNEIDIKRKNPYADMSRGEKVKAAATDFTYFGIIVGGVVMIGAVVYALYKVLFSSQGPYGIYSKALKECQRSTEIEDFFGHPIKGYGETGSRRRRRHINHQSFQVNGVPHLRMQFYIEGPALKGTVHIEMTTNRESQKYEYLYFIVTSDGYPKRTIVLHDNR